jgi:uncharacterized protein (DUF2062 family)
MLTGPLQLCNETVHRSIQTRYGRLGHVIVKQEDARHSWVRRKLVSPVVRLLRRGASPQQLAWSLVAGLMIGMNPVIGSTTVLTIAITHLFKLNHSASQIGNHIAYPLQIALFLPLLQAGSVVFRTEPIPLAKADILALVREHPLQLVRMLWTWEWHALVLWIAVVAVLMPALAVLLTRVLERAMRRVKPKQDTAVRSLN